MTRSTQRNARQVAAIIAEIMHRSQRLHGRLSDADLRTLARREAIGPAFRRQLQRQALQQGYLLYRLEGMEPTLSTAVISLEWAGTVPLVPVDELFTSAVFER